MSIYVPSDTRAALGGGMLDNCESRSLFQSCFAEPAATDNTTPTRKDWFRALIGPRRKTIQPARPDWLPAGSDRLHGRLMSRLMIGMSGGVMENANLTFDRYGLPIIPGSAVKGCARRMALQALHDWIQEQETPGSEERPAEDDACAPCCENFKTPAEMLAAIVRIFGWVEKDWEAGKKDGLFQSDLGWACGEDYGAIWKQAAQYLCENFHWEFTVQTPWEKLPDFAGTIAFLEAKPNADPGLELDVLTPHHGEYYKPEPDREKKPRDWDKWNKYRDAPDTEDPVPVFFPAIKAQGDKDYFTFPLILLPRSADDDLAVAKTWLANGLELFGLGGKTAAGYGWFDASESLQKAVKEIQDRRQKIAQEEEKRKAEEEKKAHEHELRRKQKEEESEAIAGLTPEEQEDWKVARLSDAQFEGKLRNFSKETKKGGPADTEKAAIIRALKDPRREIWEQFKIKATKGELATAAQAIRTLNKQLYGDKMP